MAGIGLRLRRLFQQESYISLLTGYLYSVVIATGPWLFSILALAILSIVSGNWLSDADLNIFRAVIIYSYAFSLILIGPFQMAFTRYLADLLYANKLEDLAPTITGMFLVVFWVALVPATVFYVFSPYNTALKLAGIVLFIAVCGIWISMIFLETLRDFASVMHGFLIGAAMSVVLSFVFSRRWGLEGYLTGFAMGQMFLMLTMVYRVHREFGMPLKPNWGFLETFRKWRYLVYLGAAYNLAIWIDKILYWISPTGLNVGYLFYDHYPYDTAVFLSYLTVIPSLAHFLMEVETEFYDRYRNFFGGIIRKRSLLTIERLRDKIFFSIRQGFVNLLKIQGTVTAIAFFFAPWIVRPIKDDPALIISFRIASLAAFFHIFLLLCLIILMYFEFYRQGAAVAAVFLAANAVATQVLIHLAPSYPGLGYLLASLIGLAAGAWLVRIYVKEVIFQTFARQPVSQEEEA